MRHLQARKKEGFVGRLRFAVITGARASVRETAFPAQGLFSRLLRASLSASPEYHPVRSGKSNVLRSGPIAVFSEGLRTKAEKRRNAPRAFVLIVNDSMRERLAESTRAAIASWYRTEVHQLRPRRGNSSSAGRPGAGAAGPRGRFQDGPLLG